MKNSDFLMALSIVVSIVALGFCCSDEYVIAATSGLISMVAFFVCLICDTIEKYNGTKEMIENQERLRRELMKVNSLPTQSIKNVYENQCFTCHRMFKSTSASIECAKCMANKTNK